MAMLSRIKPCPQYMPPLALIWQARKAAYRLIAEQAECPPPPCVPICPVELFDRRFTLNDHEHMERTFTIASQDITKAFGTAMAGGTDCWGWACPLVLALDELASKWVWGWGGVTCQVRTL